MAPILEVKNLHHVYSAGTPFEHIALDDISFGVERGEFVGIIGHTGSGKSTLIQHLNGLLKPTSGDILLDGKDIWSDKALTRQSRFRVGLVFQYPEYQLFEETVYKDIAFGPKNMGLKGEEIDRRVREAAGFVGITEEQLQVSPFELSGGQKRRVAIAGVIAMEPEVLILDEPAAGLDPEGREEILSNIEAYRKSKDATIIMVSHSMADVARLADRILVLNGAHLAMDGTPEQVFEQAEQLEQMGLDIPPITRVFLKLREMGLDVPRVYTVEQAVGVLTRLKGGNADA
ncbi:MAG: energy-coupling factor transporter ATPase [Oscillospiraceae bacterium]|nr:energy-coupling factor transporter ATPase [Oscillospiraceae bacterium]